MKRLPPSPTQRIDPERRLAFTYGGRAFSGFQGDSVASALYADGVRIFSRSIKYHRPRGLYSLDGECSNSLMEIDGQPNVRAETTPLKQGMVVKPQNVLGSPEWDWWGLMDKLDWAMPAGFYYRAFHKPYDLWPFFLNRIRQAAGIGRLSEDWKGGNYEQISLNAEVCVLGGGPAGLSAALAASAFGLRVVLLEARPWLGGFYDWRVREYQPGVSLNERAEELSQEAMKVQNLRMFRNTFVTGLWGDNLVTAFQIGGAQEGFEERNIEVRATSVVVTTGCMERPLVFENNDRPGVMQVGCAHRLGMTYGVLPGKSAVFSVGHDLGLEAAVDLADLGMKILAVADHRRDGHEPTLVEALAERGVPFLAGWAASKVEGEKGVTGVVLNSLDGSERKRIGCQILVASAGMTPVSGPLAMTEAKMTYDRHTNFFLPEEMPPHVHAGGRLLGYRDPKSIELSGRRAGLSAARDCHAPAEEALQEAREALAGSRGPARGSRLPVAPGIGSGSKSFLCLDEDATVKHIAQACQHGFDLPELAKRFTATGTGPGQGAVPGHNLSLLLSQFRGEEVDEMPPTTVRPPLVPTLLATCAGPKHDLFKRTPLHQVQAEAGAVFRRVGAWKRARYFSEDRTSREEIAAVHENVGVIDVSTLGKFRIFGPDAVRALDRVFVGDMGRVPTDRVKYVAMCNDDGCLIDDGVIVRLGEDEYYFTTTTGRAGQTLEWFLYHTRYEDWDYQMVDLTDAYGAVNLAGPCARDLLGKLTDADLSNEAFPYLGYREVVLAGRVNAKVMRLGFVGELSYEIHVPSSVTRHVWDLLLEAGKAFSLRPFGLEAQSVLRLEKGHVLIGQDTEIRVTLHDLGLGFLWHREKRAAKTVGAPALRFTEQQEDRLKLVGFQMENPEEVPGEGAIIVDDENVRGHVTSSRFSTVLGRCIGMALVQAPLAMPGTELSVFQEGLGGRRLQARVVQRPFYDPEGKRLRM